MRVELNEPGGHPRLPARSRAPSSAGQLAGVHRGGRRQPALVNAMTIDVEDYFQVQAFSDRFHRQDWPTVECRVERNTARILAMLAEHRCAATFFTLGWIAERFPGLVREIQSLGHEVASHGLAHFRADQQSPAAFRSDIRRAKAILEDITGTPVRGYRAATFSIGWDNLWAFDVLAEEGYSYSSSTYPIRHDLYGMPGAPRFAFHPRADSSILECPISTVAVRGHVLPCGGGGYFRLLPYRLSRWQLERLNHKERQPGVFYFHPWEIDVDQPRPRGLPLRTRIRHYVNIGRMEARLRRLLADFAWDRMDRVFPEIAAPADGTAA
jgi:polysaccharide deacetylase family protein (PEP-CTERM system associated)